MSRTGRGQERLFLDANVLFSAAYSGEAGVGALWELEGVVLITSTYAAEEARRNLERPGQRERLRELLASMTVSNALADPAEYPEIEGCGLPEKDLPILRAAVAAGATHLVTGDRQHFGHLYQKTSSGVLVQNPGAYLSGRGG